MTWNFVEFLHEGLFPSITACYVLKYISSILNRELLSHLGVNRKSTTSAQMDWWIATNGLLSTDVFVSNLLSFFFSFPITLFYLLLPNVLFLFDLFSFCYSSSFRDLCLILLCFLYTHSFWYSSSDTSCWYFCSFFLFFLFSSILLLFFFMLPCCSCFYSFSFSVLFSPLFYMLLLFLLLVLYSTFLSSLFFYLFIFTFVLFYYFLSSLFCL